MKTIAATKLLAGDATALAFGMHFIADFGHQITVPIYQKIHIAPLTGWKKTTTV
jgi:hypothetical protein